MPTRSAIIILLLCLAACTPSPVKEAYNKCVKRLAESTGMSKSDAKSICQRILDECEDSKSEQCQKLIKPYLSSK